MVDRVDIPTDRPVQNVEGQQSGQQAPPQDQTQQPSHQTSNESTPGRPEWLPDKFNSPEDLAKAYNELQKQFTRDRQSKAKSDTPTGGGEEQPQGEKKPEAQEMQEQAEEVLESKGLSLEEFSSYFDQHGELSEDHYKSLEDVGIPRVYVDNYIAGIQALQQQSIQVALERVGGEQNFVQMAEWARANLDQEYIDAYNEAVSSGNKSRAMNALDGLYSLYTKSVGKEPSLVHGDTKGGSSEFYRSVDEMTRDMSNPLYKTDPSFREKVKQKLARSNIYT